MIFPASSNCARERALSTFCYSPFTKGCRKNSPLCHRRLAWKVQTNGENDYYLKSLSLPASFLVSLTTLDKNYYHLFTLQPRYIYEGVFLLKGWKNKKQYIIWPSRCMVVDFSGVILAPLRSTLNNWSSFWSYINNNMINVCLTVYF